jgi:hypothetical protein
MKHQDLPVLRCGRLRFVEVVEVSLSLANNTCRITEPVRLVAEERCDEDSAVTT